MEAWDNEDVDIERLCNRVISGVMHHPAQREMGEDGARDGRMLMFRSVEEWWNNMDRSQQDDYRRKLSREGVERGDNHKEGVYDTGHGHGCAGKLGMHKQFGGNSGEPQSMEDKIASEAAGAIIGGLTGGISSFVSESTGGQINLPTSENPTQGGGLLGAASSLLSGAFSAGETETFESRPHRQNDGGVTQSIEQYGRSSDGRRYEQAEFTDTRYDDGRERREFQRFEQRDDGRGGEQGYGYEQREERREYGGGFQRTEERRWEGGNDYQRQEQYGGGGGYDGGRREERREEGGWEGRREEGGYGGGFGGGRHEERREEGGFGGGFGGYDGGRREERREEGGWEGRRQEGGFGGGYDGGRREEGEGYGEQRHHQRRGSRGRDDDDDDNERRHHQRRGSRDNDDDNERRGGWFS